MNRLTSLLVSIFASGVCAQTASVVPYGVGCGPSLSWTGSPRIGQSVTFLYAGPNVYFDIHGNTLYDRPVLLLGGSDQQIGATPLPLLLPSSITNGQPACFLLQSSEIVIVMPFQAPFPPVKF